MHYVGRSSMEVRVQVHAEDPIRGTVTHTNSAYFVFVALDEAGEPAEVPRLQLETAEERSRWQAAERRQAHRVAGKSKAPGD